MENKYKELKEQGIFDFGVMPYNERPGGQSCGMVSHMIFVEHKGIGLRIEIDNYKSQIKNLDLAMELMELALRLTDKSIPVKDWSKANKDNLI